MNPYFLLGGGILWLLSVAGSFTYGQHVEGLNCAVKESKAVEVGQQQKDQTAAKAGTVATKVEAGNAEQKVITRTVTQYVDKIVDRPIYRDGVACLDDDGVRAVNAKIAGTADAAGKLNGEVPATDAPH